MAELLTAIILAGGRGERLQPLTSDRPKAMVAIAGRPILFHQLTWLRRCGVGRVILACGYRSDVIAAAVGDGSAWDLDLRLSVEVTKLGRGGALKLAATAVPLTGTFLALNGDLITDLDLQAFLGHHADHTALATLAVAPLRSPHGIVLVKGDTVAGFQEKPVLPHWINAGIYALSPAIVPRLPDVGDHEDVLFPELACSGQLGWYPVAGRWHSVDTAKDVAEVGAELLGDVRPWPRAGVSAAAGTSLPRDYDGD